MVLRRSDDSGDGRNIDYGTAETREMLRCGIQQRQATNREEVVGRDAAIDISRPMCDNAKRTW